MFKLSDYGYLTVPFPLHSVILSQDLVCVGTCRPGPSWCLPCGVPVQGSREQFGSFLPSPTDAQAGTFYSSLFQTCGNDHLYTHLLVHARVTHDQCNNYSMLKCVHPYLALQHGLLSHKLSFLIGKMGTNMHFGNNYMLQCSCKHILQPVKYSMSISCLLFRQETFRMHGAPPTLGTHQTGLSRGPSVCSQENKSLRRTTQNTQARSLAWPGAAEAGKASERT